MSARAAVEPRLKTLFTLDPETTEGLPRSYWALWGATLVNRLGTFVLPMMMVYLTRARNLPLEEAGAILSLFGAGGLVSHLSGGVLADRVGRRFTMLLSLTTGAGFMLLLGAAQTPSQLAAAALGLGLTSSTPPLKRMWLTWWRRRTD
jgi:MFS family permease